MLPTDYAKNLFNDFFGIYIPNSPYIAVFNSFDPFLEKNQPFI